MKARTKNIIRNNVIDVAICAIAVVMAIFMLQPIMALTKKIDLFALICVSSVLASAMNHIAAKAGLLVDIKYKNAWLSIWFSSGSGLYVLFFWAVFVITLNLSFSALGISSEELRPMIEIWSNK